MSTSIETTKTGEPSLTKDILDLVRYYLGGRRGIIVLALAAAGIGLYLGWGWLAAVGVATLLIVLAPCAAMCALGLCMNKKGGKSCSTESSAGAQDAKTNPSSPPPSAKVRDDA